MIRAARTYSKPNGFRPSLPIFPVGKDKRPLIPEWQNQATPDWNHIRQWWTQWPDANIGMLCRGFVVIDVDEHDPAVSGADSLREFEREHGALPDTWMQLTPSGGTHYFFSCDDPSITPMTGILPGVDIRASASYVVIAPSVLADGRKYEWEAGHMPHETPLAPLPDSLRDLIKAKRSSRSKQTEVPEVVKKGERNDVLFRYACSLRSKGMTDSEMQATLEVVNRNRCNPPLREDEVKAIVASAARFERGTVKQGMEPSRFQFRPKDLSDAGNAEAFSQWVGNRLLWCDALGWLVWDGMRYAQNDHAATELAIEFSLQLLDDATAQYKAEIRTDPDTGKLAISEATKNYLKHAQKTRSSMAITNFMKLSMSYLHIKADRLDAQDWVLNTPAGIVDLRTGKMGPHDPKALCTKITLCAPSDENMAIWVDVLNLVSDDDPEWIAYNHMLKGSMIFGKVREEKILMEFGGGSNGKSTESNAEVRVLGDYAGTIDSTVLTTDRQNRGAALATLRGKRLVICGELEEGQRLSISTLKKLASTDPLTIEEKYRQPETIMPSHHIVLYSNFLPRVGSTDAGTWRRISVLPYRATMPEGDAEIKNYSDILVEKAGGAILKWLIDGAVEYWQAGCHIEVPECVRQATENYRAGEDWLQGFLSECCIVERDRKERAGLLYDTYKKYAESIGDWPRRNSDFVKAMEGAGFKSVTAGGGKKYWLGVAINYAEIDTINSARAI